MRSDPVELWIRIRLNSNYPFIAYKNDHYHHTFYIINCTFIFLRFFCSFPCLNDLPFNFILSLIGSSFAFKMLFLFFLFLSLYLFTLPTNTRIIVEGIFDKSDNTGTFSLLVLCALPLVFLLHVPTFVPTASFIDVVLVILREFSPRLEIVPPFVKLFDIR